MPKLHFLFKAIKRPLEKCAYAVFDSLVNSRLIFEVLKMLIIRMGVRIQLVHDALFVEKER